MKNTLPAQHGLPESVLNTTQLCPTTAEGVSITDAQYDALSAGVARGSDILVCSPTSTGKTLIGWWGVVGALMRGERVVYLVSYRALAHQKFQEARRLFLAEYLQGDQSAIVCATGDSVEDASGRKTSAPLSSRILVATYEKFLGCLSTGGPPRDLTDTTFVCDEIQLIGDKTRGQSVELLLTLIRRSGWRQFVGLSAVLSSSDGQALAQWLSLALVVSTNREKKLVIECRSPDRIVSVTSAPDRDPEWTQRPIGNAKFDPPAALVAEVAAVATLRPVIVFCMRVDDTFELAAKAASSRAASKIVKVPNGFDISTALLEILRKGVAFHNAELSEEERLFVEQRLADGEVHIVFSTSTLAAGVNFPLGSAVFAAWKRWNRERARHEPIGRSEFQNMAGRVGRMGQAAGNGLVVLSATGAADQQVATTLMDATGHEDLGNGITPEDFGALVLQIFAGKLCRSREQAFSLLESTLSAARESARNVAGVAHWQGHLDSQVDRLIGLGCLIESGQTLHVTAIGEAVARSGLKPETAMYFVEGLSRLGASLSSLLPSRAGVNDEDGLSFVLAHAALASPEYNMTGGRPTRQVHWRVTQPQLVANPYARRLSSMLFSQPWAADVAAANGALLLAGWAAGLPRTAIETSVGTVRMGTVQALARDVAWILTGISDIVGTVTAPALADESKPEVLRGSPTAEASVRMLARAMRRQAARINIGLPSDVLWMTSLELQVPPRRLSRSQILALRNKGLVRPIELMDGGTEADQRRREALDAVANPRLANLTRDAAKHWKVEDRRYCKRLHLRRATKVGGVEVVEALYTARQEAFEDAFTSALNYLAVPYSKLDTPGQVGRPDYLIMMEALPEIVVELKTKVSDTDLVPFNAAVEVLTAAELLGMPNHSCLTVCSPGVEPSVPGLIEACGRLCVVEVCDLAEAILRLREGALSRNEFHNWLTTPGIALSDDLPHSH